MTEQRLAAELDYQLLLAGAEAPAFPTIMGVDASASMPHYRPGAKRLKRGSLLLVDFGARVRGYVCDLTRVLFAGKIGPHVRSVYNLVREAQAAGIDRVGPGVPLAEVDAAARGIIAAAGHDKDFRHGLGHGFGRLIHEAPVLAPKGVKGSLEPGMVVTVEPGVYLKGRFGIRLEDDVLVTESGRRLLTHLEKDPEAMVL
jgi:Xaa-Pro aminopeptidase